MTVFRKDERWCAWTGSRVAPGKLEKQEALFSFKCWLFCITLATVYSSCCTGEKGSGWVMHPDDFPLLISDSYTLCQIRFYTVCGLDINLSSSLFFYCLVRQEEDSRKANPFFSTTNGTPSDWALDSAPLWQLLMSEVRDGWVSWTYLIFLAPCCIF